MQDFAVVDFSFGISIVVDKRFVCRTYVHWAKTKQNKAELVTTRRHEADMVTTRRLLTWSEILGHLSGVEPPLAAMLLLLPSQLDQASRVTEQLSEQHGVGTGRRPSAL